MNWIKNFIRPRIQTLLGAKREVAENMWVKCPETGEMVFYRDLEANQFVFPGSGHHHRMPVDARLKSIFDGAVWDRISFPAVAADPLKFRDEKKYADRLKDIRNFEAYSDRNGIRIVKFFLNVSKEEQKKRFLARIDTPSKNWKFEEGDVKERGYWKDYMHAYEDAIQSTGTPECPWYVVPADDKKNMRLIVSAAILHEMQSMKLKYPELPAEQKAELAAAKKFLLAE